MRQNENWRGPHSMKGELKPQSKVWCRGMKEWQLASSVPEFFNDLPPDLEGELTPTPPSVSGSQTEPDKSNSTTSSEAKQPEESSHWGWPVLIAGVVFLIYVWIAGLDRLVRNLLLGMAAIIIGGIIRTISGIFKK